MIRKSVIFDNLFNSKSITVYRLLIFARFVLSALMVLDKTLFANIITELTTSIETLANEIGDVDTNLNTQKVSTSSVTKFLKGFAKYMSDKEPFIAEALGGRNTEAYLSFYPKGITEYSQVTNTTMSILSMRVFKAAVKYADLLGTTLSGTLQSFSPDFLKIYNSQQSQIGTVKNDRGQRGVASLNLSVVLTKTVHVVAAQYPGNEVIGKQIFPFDMLYPKEQSNKQVIEGSLLAGENKSVRNQTLTTRVKVTVSNLSLNADVLVWLSAVAGGTPPATAMVIKPGLGSTFSAAKLGDLKNTFLMIGNASTVNPLDFKIEIVGLKKEKKAAAADDKDIKILNAS